MHTNQYLRRFSGVLLSSLFCVNACSGEPPKNAPSGDKPGAAATRPSDSGIDLTSPPNGPKVKADEAAIRAMLTARFGPLMRGVRIKAEATEGDVRVQLRGDVPSEAARDAIMRETAARVEGLRVQDFDLTVAGPAALADFFETPVGNNTGVGFSLDLHIAAVMDDNVSEMPSLLDLWAKKRINKLPSVENKVLRILAISPDGKLLVTGHIRGTVVLWQLPMGDKPEILEKSRDINAYEAPGAMDISPDGKLLAYILSGDLWLRSLDASRENRMLGKHERQQTSYFVAFSPDGSMLVSADASSNKLLLCDVKAKSRKREISLEQTFLRALAWSPDSKTIALGRSSGDSSILLVDVDSGKIRSVPLADANSVSEIAYSPDGKTLAIRLQSQGIVLWDMAADKEWTRLDPKKIGAGRGMGFSADGGTLAVAHAGETSYGRKDDPSGIQFWNVSQRPGAGPAADFPPRSQALAPSDHQPIGQRDDWLTSQILERIKTDAGTRMATDVSVEVLPDGSVRVRGTVPHAEVKENVTRTIERQFPIESEPGQPPKPRRVINEMNVVESSHRRGLIGKIRNRLR